VKDIVSQEVFVHFLKENKMKYVIDHTKTSDNEYELDACFHWDYWAIPFCIYWWKHADGLYNACLDVSIHILCFSFHFEWWKWGEKI